MPISGSDPALLQARFGVARFGATRFGYLNPVNTVVLIGGVDCSVFIERGSLRISYALNDEPDTASFRVDPEIPVVPTSGQTIGIAIGSARRLIFGGQIDVLTSVRRQGHQSPWLEVPCIDWTRLFDRRRVTRLWTDASASRIAYDIVDDHTSGFTRLNVAPNLPTIEYFAAVNESPSSLFRRLAVLIRGGCFWDAGRDVHLFGEDGPVRTRTLPLELTNARVSLVRFTHQDDPTQLRTRVIVEGQGTQVLAEIAADETVLPVETVEMFAAAGGEARVDQAVIAYAGIVAGGGGSLVGPGVAPASPLFVTLQGGAGVDSGGHTYAYTWVTASGETLPSPLWGAAPGPIDAPSTAPSRALAGGAGLEIGTYLYGVTFVAGGETTPGPTGAVVTDAGIAAPPSPGGVLDVSTGAEHTGGDYAIGDSVWVRVAYVDASGNETGGTDSNTAVIQNLRGLPEAFIVDNIPVPSDPNVVLKRVYLNKNGSFGKYYTLAPGNTSLWWITGGSDGSFPIGGNPQRQQVQLTSIPLGPTGTTARKIYRTTVGGATLKLVATLSDNTTTSYLDSTADGSLGADAPSSNASALNQVALSAIAVGPSGVTSRKVYRTALLSAQLQLVATIGDNTTTTYLDTLADSGLGANAPTGDTSGLTQPTGQVNAGSDTLIVAGPGAFATSGGWALVGGQIIRYAGISGQTLTGIPTSGAYSLQATVNYGTTILEAPRLTGVSGLNYAVAKGAAVRLRVTRNDLTAQAARAVIEGGDGIHEHVISDDTLSIAGATALADAELAVFSRTLLSTEWDTEDMNAYVGRAQPIALTAPAVAGALTITHAELTFSIPNQRPERRVRASTVKTSGLLDVVATE